MVLEGDFAFAISNTLILLYSHYHLFHYEFRMSISMYLLGKMFFRLFLHWSTHVRSIFYHLLIYRIDSDVHLNNGKGKGNADTPIRHEQ